MKLAITGGHFSPAYALISEKLHSDVVVIGRRSAFDHDKSQSFEAMVCEEHNIPFETIRAVRFSRVNILKTIINLIKFPMGVYDASKILKKHKVDVVLSLGGYIGLSTSIAAFFNGIPIVVHEQTQKAGMSNLISAFFAKRVCVSFDSSLKAFPKQKTVKTGNPIRLEVGKVGKALIDETKNILYITGGSTGSHAINGAIFNALPQLLEKFTIIHQVGNTSLTHDSEISQKMKNELPENLKKKYFPYEFITPENIGWVLKNAEIVISRAGINTVLELMFLEKPSILIPISAGQKEEQHENANLLKKVGLSETIEEKDLDKSLVLTIEQMHENLKKYTIDSQEKGKYVISDSSKLLYSEILKAHETKTQK